MFEVVCWLWTPTKNYRSQFSTHHVNILKNMVQRNYPHPHRFSCITDHTSGFDPDVRVIPLWDTFSKLESIYGPDTPCCYRRLKAFSPEMKEIIGERFISLDLDVVITGDVSSVWNRPDDFMIWGATQRQTPYNGSMWMMDAGARSVVYEKFKADPKKAIERAREAGFFGTDQAWMCYILGPKEKRWAEHDGVYSYRMHVKRQGGALPKGAKIVFFEGHYDPWSPIIQESCPWVKDHYR